jgi:hypothetical protein
MERLSFNFRTQESMEVIQKFLAEDGTLSVRMLEEGD